MVLFEPSVTLISPESNCLPFGSQPVYRTTTERLRVATEPVPGVTSWTYMPDARFVIAARLTPRAEANVVRSMSPAIGTGAEVAADAGVEALWPQALTTAIAAISTRCNTMMPDVLDFMIPSFPRRHSMTAVPPQVIPAVGERAPDFTLASTSGEKVTLSSLRGKPVLLAFFPLAFTSTCTAEQCEMRDDDEQFVARGVTVLPISVDSTASLKEYKAKHGMKVHLLSDFRRDVSRLYGVLLEDRYYSNRAYFLLDGEGVIRWEHVETNPSHRRPDSEILAAIDRLPSQM
jgi:mycoredoxin-dependent peroxiredoxin